MSSLLDYMTTIELEFDKPIINDPEIVTGIEYVGPLVVTDAMVTVSGYYSGRDKKYALDNNLGTRWQTPSSGIPGWFTANFGTLQILGKIRVYTITGQYPVSAYTIQGSNDNSNWTDVISGTIATGTTQWTDIIFTPATFQYWRFYVTAGTSNYATIYEIQYYTVQTAYNTNGFKVTADEYNKMPAGDVVNEEYTVKKIRYAAPRITEVDADLSIATLSDTVYKTGTIELAPEE